MKTMAAALFVILLSVSMSGSSRAQSSTEITGATWMSLSRDARLGFVAGYINGLQLMSRKFSLNLEPMIHEDLTATDWNDRLYEKLLKQPELRKQPVGEVLFNIIEGASDKTDKKSGAIPEPKK